MDRLNQILHFNSHVFYPCLKLSMWFLCGGGGGRGEYPILFILVMEALTTVGGQSTVRVSLLRKTNDTFVFMMLIGLSC